MVCVLYITCKCWWYSLYIDVLSWSYNFIAPSHPTWRWPSCYAHTTRAPAPTHCRIVWQPSLPQPSVGGLSVAKTREIRWKSRSEAAKREWQSGPTLTRDLCLVYTWYVHGISSYIPGISCIWVKHIVWVQLSCCPVIQCYVRVFQVLPTSLAWISFHVY